METHGGGYVPEFDLQETRKDNLTKTFQEISQSRSVPAWQIEDTARDVETTRHVGSEIQETTQDVPTVPVMGQEGSQRPTWHRQVWIGQLPDILPRSHTTQRRGQGTEEIH